MNLNYQNEEETYLIIGKCMEVHNELGHGFSEIVYKDALEIAFRQDEIFFEREKCFEIYFRDILLPHHFYADFVVLGNVILELKCLSKLTNEHISQTLNYLKVSGCKVGLLVNFATQKLEVKRLVL